MPAELIGDPAVSGVVTNDSGMDQMDVQLVAVLFDKADAGAG